MSSAHVVGKTQTFELTMREKPGGVVTGALFAVARKLKEGMPHVMEDCRVLGMIVRLVGVAGEFVLPPVQDPAARKPLFVAGGIGITPFLSMLKAIRERDEERDVVLLISTREPVTIFPSLQYDLTGLDQEPFACRCTCRKQPCSGTGLTAVWPFGPSVILQPCPFALLIRSP